MGRVDRSHKSLSSLAYQGCARSEYPASSQTPRTAQASEQDSQYKYDQSVQANQYLRDIKPVNVGNQWSYLCSLVMFFSSISDEKNSNTKAAEYPRNKEENDSGMSGDLKKIRAQFIRAKSSGNGLRYELMVSQSDGYLEALSQYNMLRDYKWGLEPNNWTVTLLPTAIQRVTARTVLEEDALLRRAVSLSSNLLQIRFLNTYLDRVCCHSRCGR